MNKDQKESILNIQEKYKFTDEEKEIVSYSNTPRTDEINHSKVLTSFILVKQLQQSTERIIDSNKFLAEAEDRNAKKMQILTWALIGVGFLQALAMLINLIV